MTAIKVHHTDTSDASWDGPAAKAALKNGETESYYRKAFAWQDPEQDATLKGSYKFIHHEVTAGGDIGAANIKGCQSGIGVLNGAMGGANIPDADRQGVWNHLAAHLKDAKVEPAELASLRSVSVTHVAETVDGGLTPPRLEFERRYLNVSVRAAQSADQKPVIEGVAAVFDQETIIAGLFREIVRPGAFTNVLAGKPDVIGSPNHDWNTVLGRTTANTLHLSQEQDGLHYAIDINTADQEAMNFYARVQRGDVHQSSYAWNVLPEGEKWSFPDDKKLLPLRELIDITELYDVSPVTFPAYPTTSANVRSKLNELNRIRSHEGQEAPPEPDAAQSPQVRNSLLRKHLDLAEKL
jgi:HK97 family phage prohead protease